MHKKDNKYSFRYCSERAIEKPVKESWEYQTYRSMNYEADLKEYKEEIVKLEKLLEDCK